jgi:hypothetical protein
MKIKLNKVFLLIYIHCKKPFTINGRPITTIDYKNSSIIKKIHDEVMGLTGGTDVPDEYQNSEIEAWFDDCPEGTTVTRSSQILPYMEMMPDSNEINDELKKKFKSPLTFAGKSRPNYLI